MKSFGIIISPDGSLEFENPNGQVDSTEIEELSKLLGTPSEEYQTCIGPDKENSGTLKVTN